MRVLRVFPRATNATPDDAGAIVNRFPGFFDEADEIKVSVSFTWDLKRAEELAKQWRAVAPVEIGGPALGLPSGEFEPGLFMKRGFTITSRGCPNRCWYCAVWKREPALRELAIKDGYVINDDNLLACSEQHVRRVFAMLARQKNRARFVGGLEAKLLQRWHAELLSHLNPDRAFFAYDTPDDLEPLAEAGKLLRQYRFDSRALRCYVLCGYRGDTFAKAEKRMRETWSAGFLPFAMLYRDKGGESSVEWRRFQRLFSRPAATISICKSGAEPSFSKEVKV